MYTTQDSSWSRAFAVAFILLGACMPVFGASKQDDVENASDASERQARRTIRRQFRAAGESLKSAVERGEMAEEDAWRAWHESRREIVEQAVEDGLLTNEQAGRYRERIGYEALGGRLKSAGDALEAATERGEMSEDEAWEAWYGERDRLIAEAVESGEVSESAAEKMLREVHRAELRDRLATANEEIESAVEEGEITEQEAGDARKEAKERLLADAISHGEIDDDGIEDVRREMRQADLKQQIGMEGQRIKASVERGEITEDEGWDAWAAARNELIDEAAAFGELDADEARDFREGYDKWATGARLRAAVERGDMSEAEAKEAWRAFEEGGNSNAHGQSRADQPSVESGGADVSREPRTPDLPVLMAAIKHVDLSEKQAKELHRIRRDAREAYRASARGDRQARQALAGRVYREFESLLDRRQWIAFESVIEKIKERRSSKRQQKATKNRKR
ncbi:MAG: hypothetical protein ACPGXK_12475 [Phycisphaerae bacterium]